MKLKKLIAKVRNTHGYENLKEYLGKDLGSLLYQIVDKADAQQVKNLNIPVVIKCEGDERRALLIDFLLFLDKKDAYYKKTTEITDKAKDFLKSINSL